MSWSLQPDLVCVLGPVVANAMEGQCRRTGGINLASQFQIKTMGECKKEGCVDFEAQKIPDHSVLMWNLALAGNWWMHAGQEDKECC